jgi:hypothetical protein
MAPDRSRPALASLIFPTRHSDEFHRRFCYPGPPIDQEDFMKSKLVCLSVLAVLMLLFAFPIAAPAAPHPAPPANAAAPAPPPHPQIQAAIYSLQQARLHLMEASHDFGGHRQDAVKSIDSALRQLQICMQY